MSEPERVLAEADLPADPFAQWASWWEEARRAATEPDAMSLATVAETGEPQVRFVLLKGVDERGWIFYTNERSAKGRALAADPRAALAFRWSALDRQVRVGGAVERLGAGASDAYFAGRARDSQLGAWASDQSDVIAGRSVLLDRLAEVTARFEGSPVPRPPWWGGFRLVPSTVEFWQGRQSRLHDRLRYRADGVGWTIERLAP